MYGSFTNYKTFSFSLGDSVYVVAGIIAASDLILRFQLHDEMMHFIAYVTGTSSVGLYNISVYKRRCCTFDESFSSLLAASATRPILFSSSCEPCGVDCGRKSCADIVCCLFSIFTFVLSPSRREPCELKH